MIVDIPQPEDFNDSGTDFLNLAWGIVYDLSSDLKDYQHTCGEIDIEYESDEEEDLDLNTHNSDEYWRRSQKSLATALSLVQQGTEFILKGLIVEVSPYLLLVGGSKNWPTNAQKNNVKFSEFKTIDAQDLINTYNTVTQNRLSDDFKTQFNKLRNKRNICMHTIDKNFEISTKEIFKEILEVNHHLIKPLAWLNIRKQFLETLPVNAVMKREYWDYDLLQSALIHETKLVIDLLNPSEVSKYFNFSKKQRCYICPDCYSSVFKRAYAKMGMEEDIPRLAQLSPNQRNSKTIYCLICNSYSDILREQCNNENCSGNVISIDLGICLSCGIDHE
jgi:hypothetical protein